MATANKNSECLIAFGSNLGDEESVFAEVRAQLSQIVGIESLVASRACRTTPVGGPAGQSDYLNAAFRFQTTLPPVAVHQTLIEIETCLGRRRRVRWGARRLDLDLLLHDDVEMVTETLTVPHPRMSFRRFVLEPASQIAGEMIHPVARTTIAELLDHLDSTPMEIVWVTSPDPVVDEIRERLLQNPANEDWQIHCVDNETEFKRRTSTAKFVAWGSRRSPNLRSAFFRGPQLLLPIESNKIEAELSAAMAASR